MGKTQGLRRGTQPKAAPAAGRSADAPKSLKPAPLVTDCAKCQKLAALKRENTLLAKRIDQLEQMERARVAAAIAGGPVAITDEQLQEAIHAAYAPAFAEVLAVPVSVALSPGEGAGDRLKAVQMIVERMAGKVTDKHELTVKREYDLSRLTDAEAATLEALLVKATPEGA